MTVGIAVLTTVASSAPRLMPSSRPAVIALPAGQADRGVRRWTSFRAYHGLRSVRESQSAEHEVRRCEGALRFAA